MNNQEIFNRVWQYFVVEGHPQAMSDTDWSCVYRTSDGNACAVGCLIPDEAYRAEADRYGASMGGLLGTISYVDEDTEKGCDALRAMLRDAGIGEDSYQLLKDLQHAHDRGGLDGPGRSSLERVAEKHGLRVPA